MQDLVTEELSRVYATAVSYLKSDEYIIQITLGNDLPNTDDMHLMKMFVCNDDDELQQSLKILLADRNSRIGRHMH